MEGFTRMATRRDRQMIAVSSDVHRKLKEASAGFDGGIGGMVGLLVDRYTVAEMKALARFSEFERRRRERERVS